MVRTMLGRLVLPLVAAAAMLAGFDAEAGCCRSRRAACCEPCCPVVYETVCPAPCRPVCADPCATVTYAAPRHAHVVIEEEVIVAPARCCASATPARVIGETIIVADSPSRTPRETPARGRLAVTTVSRSVR